MNELALSNDLNVITAEINSYKQMAGQAIFEIGKRLKHVKEQKSHQDFVKWCESEVNFKWRQAFKYIKAYEKFSHLSLGANMSLKKMDLLSTFDDEQLETPIETSSGEVKKPTEMTQREIEEYKRKLKEAEQAKKQAEQLAEQAKRSESIALKQLEEMEEQEPEVIERVVERVVKDESEIISLKNRLQQIEQQKKDMEQKIQQEQYYADQYRNLKSDIERLSDEKENIIKQIDNASTIGKFIARVERSFEEDLSPIKYTNAIHYAKDNESVKEAVEKIVSRVEKWCDEIRKEAGLNNIIDAEVIEYE